MGIRIKIKNSVIVLANGEEAGTLREEIRGFDISDKTPLDCMDFLRKLKERYGKKEG